MNLGEIKQECWELTRDTALEDEDKLWPSNEMDRYINRIYRDIARKTLCISDSTSPEVCQIQSAPINHSTYIPGSLDYTWANDPNSWLYHKDVAPYLYPLHPSVLQVREAKWNVRPWKLVIVSSGKWRENPWWEQVIGAPTECALDLENGKLALNFRSEDSDIIRLYVNRLPLVDLVTDDDVPEFKEDYHYLFLNGVLNLMYRKHDADTFDKEKAAAAMDQYLLDVDEIKAQESMIHRRLRPNYSMGAFR